MKFVVLVLAVASVASAGYLSPGGFGAPVVGGYHAPIVGGGYHAPLVGGGYHASLAGGYAAPLVNGYNAPVYGGYHAPVAASPLAYSAPGFGYNGFNGGFAGAGFGYDLWKKKKASA